MEERSSNEIKVLSWTCFEITKEKFREDNYKTMVSDIRVLKMEIHRKDVKDVFDFKKNLY